MPSLRSFVLPVLASALAACQSLPNAPRVAVVQLMPTSAAEAAKLFPVGSVKFTQLDNGRVLVEAAVAGLKPNAEHGFHLHETPDCSGDGTKTGGHFNPDGHAHNHPGNAQRHAGAMFNLKTDPSGEGTLRQEVDTITLGEGKYSIIGKPLITHRDPDDYKSQPLGNAGPRIACGLVTLQAES